MTNKEIITALQSVLSVMDKRLSISGIENMNAIADCARVLNAVCVELRKEEAEAS